MKHEKNKGKNYIFRDKDVDGVISDAVKGINSSHSAQESLEDVLSRMLMLTYYKTEGVILDSDYFILSDGTDLTYLMPKVADLTMRAFSILGNPSYFLFDFFSYDNINEEITLILTEIEYD